MENYVRLSSAGQQMLDKTMGSLVMWLHFHFIYLFLYYLRNLAYGKSEEILAKTTVKS